MCKNLVILLTIGISVASQNLTAQDSECPPDQDKQLSTVDPIFRYATKRKEANQSLMQLLTLMDEQNIAFRNKDGSENVYIHPKLETWYEATVSKINEDNDFATHFRYLINDEPRYVNGESGFGTHRRYALLAPNSLHRDFSAAITSLYSLKERRQQNPQETFVQSALALNLQSLQADFGRKASTGSDPFRSAFVIGDEPSKNSDSSETTKVKIVVPGYYGISTLDAEVSSAYLTAPNAKLMDHIKSVGMIRRAPRDLIPTNVNGFTPTTFTLAKPATGVVQQHKYGIEYGKTSETMEIPVGAVVLIENADPYRLYEYRFKAIYYPPQKDDGSPRIRVEAPINLVEQNLALKGLLLK